MKQFPLLKEEEVAVLRALKATGVVLDESFSICVSDVQTCYTVFVNLNQALDYVKEMQLIRDDVEYVIYNKAQSAISVFD